jgi:hypothetical protein
MSARGAAANENKKTESVPPFYRLNRRAMALRRKIFEISLEAIKKLPKGATDEQRLAWIIAEYPYFHYPDLQKWMHAVLVVQRNRCNIGLGYYLPPGPSREAKLLGLQEAIAL